ncbi:MAG: STAS domain-containing protein [Gemmatimonadota bacterium]|uniref:STAS domain-containing protein n=1 Tax=Candidatus Palauibacter scopulicola TaxID=3056741 RepID=UPI00239C63FB|nr:STAS domain-containing protein [Candidatus Palauibacter scopulicola]MDE2663912.1 STAS domain-containing protein [Candidatus Palauibacter scopulicola]
MTFSIEQTGANTLVTVGGQLTINNRGELKERVLARLAGGDTDFVIDFSEADYIDSSGLGVLVSLSKHIRDAGGRLTLTGLNEDLERLFALTRLDSLFEIVESRAAALGES